MSVRTSALALALLVLCCACGGQQSGSSQGGSKSTDTSRPTYTKVPPTTAPQTTPPTRTTTNPYVPAAQACTTSPAFHELPLQPDNEIERALAASLRVCVRANGATSSGGAQYELQVLNAGPGVWVLEGTQGWSDEAVGRGPLAVQLFRTATRSKYDGLAVEPGQQAFVRVPDSYELRLHLDAALQAEWMFVSRVVERVKSKITDLTVGRLTPESRALIACSQSAYGIGQQLLALKEDRSSEMLVRTVSDGTTNAAQCVTAVDQAAAEARAAGRPTLELADLRFSRLLARATTELEGFGLRGALDLSRFRIRVH